jgi:hypothetical protein
MSCSGWPDCTSGGMPSNFTAASKTGDGDIFIIVI